MEFVNNKETGPLKGLEEKDDENLYDMQERSISMGWNSLYKIDI